MATYSKADCKQKKMIYNRNSESVNYSPNKTPETFQALKLLPSDSP